MIALLVVVMMFGIGLRTTAADFREVMDQRGRVLVAVAANLIVVPVLTLSLCRVADLPEAVTVGLVLCAASPGGPTGPLFAAQAGGHLAIAVTVMVSLSVVAVFTAPLTVALALDAAAGVDVDDLLLPMVGTLVAFQLAPLAAGAGIRWWRPARADRWAGPALRVSNLLLLTVIVGLLVTKGAVLLQMGWVGLGVCVLLAATNVGVGACVGGTPPVQRSLALVTGVRNISLSLLMAAAHLPDPLTDVAVLSFGLFTMLVPAAAAALWARWPTDVRVKSIQEQ